MWVAIRSRNHRSCEITRALVISHDRWFLDRIATHILAYEDDGNVVFHEGNYSEYEDDRRQRVGAEAAVPSRVKHRKLK